MSACSPHSSHFTSRKMSFSLEIIMSTRALLSHAFCISVNLSDNSLFRYSATDGRLSCVYETNIHAAVTLFLFFLRIYIIFCKFLLHLMYFTLHLSIEKKNHLKSEKFTDNGADCGAAHNLIIPSPFTFLENFVCSVQWNNVVLKCLTQTLD